MVRFRRRRSTPSHWPTDCFGSIVLKNSSFRVDHNSRTLGRPSRIKRCGFGRESGFLACDYGNRLAAATISTDCSSPPKSTFPPALVFGVFQRYRSTPASQLAAASRLIRAQREWPHSDRAANRCAKFASSHLPTRPSSRRSANLQ
jgi:hypothetical protein